MESSSLTQTEHSTEEKHTETEEIRTTQTEFDINQICQKYQLTELHKRKLQTLIIDASQQEAIQNVEQRTDKWKESRKNRITASKFGAARNHCPYNTKSKLLKELLWDTFQGNFATEYGRNNEQNAEDKYVQIMRHHFKLTEEEFYVTHVGLTVPIHYPWAGVSPDGFVFDNSEPIHKHGGLEIKAPWKGKLYNHIPSQYYDQLQGAMGFLNIPWWDFVVWTPSQTQIRRVWFDKMYWEQELFPRLEEFYMSDYLPRLVLKECGDLQYNHENAVTEIDIHD